MAQSHNAKKGPCQNSEMVRLIVSFFVTKLLTCSVFSWVHFPRHVSYFYYYSRSHEHIEILTVNGELLFFRQRDGPFYPTLRLLHKCKILMPTALWLCFEFLLTVIKKYFPSVDPFILPHQQVDKGAIKFVLSGANIMCPGLTSPGARLYPAESDTVVVSFYTWCCMWKLYLWNCPTKPSSWCKE